MNVTFEAHFKGSLSKAILTTFAFCMVQIFLASCQVEY